MMQTVQVRLPRQQLKQIDNEVRQGRYQSRSEAIRSALDKLGLFAAVERFREAAEWEEVVDFTKINKGGVEIKDILSRL